MLKSFPKILIITFLAVLFFQISSVEAAESYEYYQKNLGIINCAGLNSGLTDASMADCSSRNAVVPPGCTTDINLCICCYFNSTPTPKPTPTPTPASGGIKFTPQILTKEAISYEFKSEDKTTGNIANLVKAIYNYAIGIIGILAAVVLMVGGVLWIIAGGNTTQIGEAKAWIGAALTGLVLALTSYLILSTVNPALVNLQTTSIPGVKEAPVSAGTPTPCCATTANCSDTFKVTEQQCRDAATNLGQTFQNYLPDGRCSSDRPWNCVAKPSETGTCTTEICENNYTEQQCKDTGGTFAAGATCPQR